VESGDELRIYSVRKATPKEKRYYMDFRIFICKGTVCLSIQWVENTLVKDGRFALSGKRVLKRKSASIQYVVVDVMESPINRPKEGQKAYYSGKKTPHTKDPGHH
jgi:hypothetical protein